MTDPIIRRLPCEAVLYLEVAGDGLSLARLVVDIPLPDPSVIVANLPAPLDADHGDSYEPAPEEVEQQAREALADFGRLLRGETTNREAA